MPVGRFRSGYRASYRTPGTIWSSLPPPLAEVVFADAVVEVGTVVGNTKQAAKTCDDAVSWEIEETGAGIDVRFTFYVSGGVTKKGKIKGNADAESEYTFMAWDGSEWDTIDTFTFDTGTTTFSVDLLPIYTINGATQLRIYKVAGTNTKLVVDCFKVITDGIVGAAPVGVGGNSGFLLLL